MAGVSLLDRQEAVRDLESRLRQALLIARLSQEQLVSSNGRLMIVRLLGHGASGVVCEAIDRKLGRKVALKLYPGLAHDAHAQAVRREAQTLAGLRHRNIVVVHDFDADMFQPGDLRCFLVVMELLSGTTLRHWMAQTRPAGDVLDVFCRAGEGLAAAHDGGIVHRDFKPENVMLDGAGEPRLVDFGLAILDSPAAGDLDSRNPEQRSIVGTLAYMAPEALRGRADARSDQFSFAAALWEALCGAFPYPIDDLDPGKRAVTASQTPNGLSPGLLDCLRRALHADPARRYPRMLDLVAHLRRLHDELRGATSIVGAPAMLADVDLTSDAHPSGPNATAPAAAVPRRSWAWLAFPAAGVASIVGVMVALGAPLGPAPAADEPTPSEWTLETRPPQPTPPTPAPPVRSAPAAPPTPAPFACPVDQVKGVWMFKDHSELYALEIGATPTSKCKFPATFKIASDQAGHGALTIEPFAPLAGAAFGKFTLAGATYTLFLAFEDGQLRGHVDIKGDRPRSSLIRGGRREADRKPPVAQDQPCAALCVHCNGLRAVDRCRAQCAGERDGPPGCPEKKH